ncbi:MAG: bifunctional diaminohydroxyphosphoribosylaminopyrimidine deaminase/5-amino-6-(5-phosphoribosylamino)uracil reductase RibD [Candidatus Binatus sp.]|uniref:bifunctional diaminohydroxyphosphoribosylaminopyrimidine deaminase/5-amino-6-(5-phosphoribosylamino)uracil reductase RibD n=1 Tax=Candidatus Binatus sp. TaxID=2811406 RepID=UPI003C763E5D
MRASVGRRALDKAATGDQRFMRAALALARDRLGLTTPNPTVGCVIVRDGKVVGRGVTGRGGRPHGETQAIADAGALARGATAYVSFEPCAHFGKTPPCANALAAAGVKRVVIGCVDPDPRVRGRGIAILKRAKIEVAAGVLEDEAQRLNEGFITRLTRGRPMGILKLAMSMDGRIAAASGDSRWISSPPSREMVHRWRRECDAVMVGAGTVIADNPRLTCRMAGGRDPVRVVIDARLRTAPAARVYRERSSASAILVTTPRNLARARRRYERPGVEVIAVAARHGKIELGRLMREFGRRGWCRVLIEGGANLAGSALSAGIVDKVAFFVAPKILGAGLPAIDAMKSRRMRDALQLGRLSARPVGDDWLLEARVSAGNARRPRRTGIVI